MTLFAPLLSTYDPSDVRYAEALQPPSRVHMLGTDSFGRDVLARVMYGGRASLVAAAACSTVVVFISLIVGSIAALAGGYVDLFVSRVIDIVLAYPRLVLAIAIAALLDASPAGVVLAIVAVSWPGYARIIRSAVLQVKQEGYVVAARCAGTPAHRILTGHIVGALAGPVLVLAALDVGEIILAISGLSFLGLGFRPPAAEWGAMLSEARPFVERAPWMFLGPGIMICGVVLSANYLSDAARDALEPRVPPRLRVPDVVEVLSSRFRRSDPQADPRPRVEGWARREAAAGGTSPVATIDHVTVDAGGHAIVTDLSLSIQPGECVGIVGESGAGKSTLALALLGMLRAPVQIREGDVRLFGERTRDWTWRDWRFVRGRYLALIHQEPGNALNPLLTIGRQIDECITAHHRCSSREARRRTCAMLERLHLESRAATQYPHEMSGGMRQRAAIAMALINEPRLLVADEPTTALDVRTQARVLEELEALRQSTGVATVFISHDLRLVARMASRIAVMKDGRIVESGATQAIFQAPQHSYTRHLLASLPALEPAHDRLVDARG